MSPNAINKLPLGTHPFKQHPGLRLEVRASKKTWTLRRRDEAGKLKQEVLGYFPDLSLAGAMSACEVARRQGPKVKAQEPKQKTVRDLVQSYVLTHIRSRRKNWRHAEALIWRHLDAIADREGVSVGRADAHAFLSQFSDRPAIQRRMKVELSATWEAAMTNGLLDDGSNPWSKIKVAPAGKRQRVLSDGELKLLVPWLWKGGMSATVRDALLLTLATGCRSGEVIGMRWSEVDLVKGEWTMPTSKNGLGRVVYLNVVAMDVLKGLADTVGTTGFVFVTQQQRILGNALWRHGKGCPVKGWSPHDLRRTCRTGLARLGVSHEVGELCLGHALGGVAGIYNLYQYGEEQKEAMRLWGAHLSELVINGRP